MIVAGSCKTMFAEVLVHPLVSDRHPCVTHPTEVGHETT